VRGLDYYRHTAFEFVTDQLGAQGTVIAGGRYDGLIEQLGGPHTPAVGWAAGIERLGMLIDAPKSEDLELALVADSSDADQLCAELAALMRQAGISAALFNTGKVRKRFDRASNTGATAILAVSRAQNAPDNHFLIRWRPTDLMGTYKLKQRIESILRQKFKFDRPEELIVGWGEMSRLREVK
ncbi:MAG: ATP phosphoribosyltransferase regulatory subunit, partial [Sphingomonas bacterium]|nr:ATP phosphoribosyltransferase regulatory subunit [Sphingomonas bacterium]